MRSISFPDFPSARTDMEAKTRWRYLHKTEVKTGCFYETIREIKCYRNSAFFSTVQILKKVFNAIEPFRLSLRYRSLKMASRVLNIRHFCDQSTTEFGWLQIEMAKLSRKSYHDGQAFYGRLHALSGSAEQVDKVRSLVKTEWSVGLKRQRDV